MARSRWFLLSLLLITLLAACGTPHATVADRQGHPVMLLGHDPEAYFTPEHKAAF